MLQSIKPFNGKYAGTYTPTLYHRAEQNYPVLYAFDANIAFGMVNDISKQLYFENGSPIIAVGIGYTDFKNWIGKRQRALLKSFYPDTKGCVINKCRN